jgi:hypothetical protein
MIKKIDDKRLEQIKRRAKETISVNVILSIGLLELEIKEEVSNDDPLVLSEEFQKFNVNCSILHKDLLKIQINDLIVNFNQNTKGI